MAIHYVFTSRINFKNPETKLFYAQAKSQGEITTREVASQISKRTGLSPSDVMASIEAFIDLIPERLALGEIVRLGDFGSFSVSISSEGVPNKEDFLQSMIKGGKINYRPGKLIQNTINNFEFKKAE